MPGKIFAQTQNVISAEAEWTNAQGELTTGSLAEAVEKVNAGGVIYLLSDVSLTKGITISKSMTITSRDSNAPCTIKNTAEDTDDRNSFGRIFTVTAGKQVLLNDIILDGGKNEGVTSYHPLICVDGNGVILRILEGTVLQNAENKSQSLCGGGVNIRSGQFYMYDGSVITNCKARHGGGIEVNGTSSAFGMAGGKIENCEADSGGGVYVNIGMFQMVGGEIAGNRAIKNVDSTDGGGGIYVRGAGKNKTAAVRIAGGKITNNTAASNGGGVLVCGAYTLLQIEGGTLEGNSAKHGGGVSMIMGTLKLYGGTITQNTAGLYGGGVLGAPTSYIYLHGNPAVFGNTANDNEDRFDNLYLDGDDDGDYPTPTSPIRLDGPLTDGVKLGLSRWVRPDEGENPYRQMIVPYNYAITQDDLDRLCRDLYADVEKYAFIPFNGEIVMVLAVDIALDKETLSFKEISDPPVCITAEVTPSNAPEKGVEWSSSDENVAVVDENGNVTPKGRGKAVITAKTKSPYHATASCNVTVGCYYQLTAIAEHGKITFSPAEDAGYLSGQQITLNVAADNGYQLTSLKAYQTDNTSAEVVITNNTFTMPDNNVTVEAVFELVPYTIGYNLNGGTLKDGETNPASYTIESGEITLNNPTRSGYTFAGWTGTGLLNPSLVVKIPTGSTGAREYTATFEIIHTHTFSPDWSKDATDHWHAATCEHTSEVSGKEEHTPVTVNGTPATCTTAGLTDGTKCSVCNMVLTAQSTIPATGHIFSNDWSKDDTNHWHAATCEHTGEVSGKAAHTWNDGAVTTQPTEEAVGVKTYTCTVCSATRTESIDKLEHIHVWSDTYQYDDTQHWKVCTKCHEADTKVNHAWDSGTFTTEPACTQTGEKTYTCTVCEKTKTETLAAAGHSFSDVWERNKTSHWHGCTKCGEKTDTDLHISDDGAVTTEPTEFEAGVKTYTCTICGYFWTEEISARGHSYGTEWKHNETDHWRECVCGAKTDVAAHIKNEGVTSKFPTCTESGEMTYICTVCGYSWTKEIPALGHSYGTEWINDEANHWHECFCGEKSEEALHIPSDWIVEAFPTTDSEGVKIKKCTVCNTELERAAIPSVPTTDNTTPVPPSEPAVTPTVTEITVKREEEILYDEPYVEDVSAGAGINDDGEDNTHSRKNYAVIIILVASSVIGFILRKKVSK